MASASAVPTAPTAPDSKPKGIPDIMRGIGNMLRIAILEYNYKASQNELTKVLQEIIGLRDGNTNLGADVTRLTRELQNANIAQTRNLNELQNAYQGWVANHNAWRDANAHLQVLQDANTQLNQDLRDARQHITDLTQANQNLQDAFAPLQQQLQQVQQENQQQLQQIQQQLQRAQDETAAAQAAAATDVAAAQRQAAADVEAARVAAEQRAQQAAIQVAQAQQRAQEAADAQAAATLAQNDAQARVTELEARLAQQGASAAQVRGLEAELETAQAAAQAAADRANQAQTAAQAAAQAAADEVQKANQARAEAEAARDASETAQQRVIEKEAEVEQERIRLGNMVENAETERAAAQQQATTANQARTDAEEARAKAEREKDEAEAERDAVRAQIDAARQEVNDATARAAESATKVRNLQNQLTQQGFSQDELATLNKQLQEANQKAHAAKAEVETVNEELRRNLEEQQNKAQTEAQIAAEEQQNLNAELADLRQRVGTTEQGNAELQARIAQVQRDLEQASETAQNTQQEATNAQQRLRDQLQHVQADANVQVAEAQRRATELQARLDEATRTGNITTAQIALLQQQFQEQQAAVQRAEEAQQEAAQWAENAERAAADEAAKVRQEAEAARTAAAEEAETARQEAAKVRQEAEEAKKQLAEQQAAAKAAAEAQAAAEAKATRQQSELAALLQQLETAKRNGEEVGALTQRLAEKESEVKKTKNELETQKLAVDAASKKKAELEERNKAIQAEAESARAQTARAEEELQRQREAFEKTQRERDTALNILKKQLTERLKSVQTKITSHPLTQEQQQEFINTATEVQTVITGMQNAEESQITNLSVRITQLEQQLEQATRQRQEEDERKQADKKKLADEQNAKTAEVKKRLNDNLEKLQIEIKKTPEDRQTILNEQVSLVKTSIDALNFENMNVEEPKIRNAIQEIMESTGTKIRTFIVMKGGGKDPTDGGFNFNDADKTVTQGSKQWGPFSDVFDASKTNQDKYNSIKPVIESLPQGKTLVIFGYGYSGSGKTYTLLGERANDKEPEVHGVTQLAIQDYITAKKKVVLEEAFEMYNDTYNPLELETTHVAYKDTEKTVFNKNLAITSVEQFNKICSDIESERKRLGHIKPTQNNPKSSRGHLFIHLTVSDSDSSGNLIICDMGGRENPNEMWKTGKYCVGKSGGGGNKIAHPIVRGKSSYYYDAGGKEQECSGAVLTTSQTATGKNVSLALGLTMSNNNITKIIKQGFYINDSINELLDFFKYDFLHKGTGWSEEKLGPNTVYDPDVKVTVRGTSGNIGIKKLFDEFEKLTPGKIKYFTFACIRPSKEFLEDSKNTMEFATKVNSCPAAKFDEVLDLARKGGSIRRQRRKKNAIFKTLKKSRLGSLALASDSGLASASNSVKVKHKTRNKKKHNMRNNTVKK